MDVLGFSEPGQLSFGVVACVSFGAFDDLLQLHFTFEEQKDISVPESLKRGRILIDSPLKKSFDFFDQTPREHPLDSVLDFFVENRPLQF